MGFFEEKTKFFRLIIYNMYLEEKRRLLYFTKLFRLFTFKISLLAEKAWNNSEILLSLVPEIQATTDNN
jgi:hypothetical protein